MTACHAPHSHRGDPAPDLFPVPTTSLPPILLFLCLCLPHEPNRSLPCHRARLFSPIRPSLVRVCFEVGPAAGKKRHPWTVQSNTSVSIPLR